jgi:hypothetical protein
MLLLNTINYLLKTRRADAKALLKSKRYAASVYMMGYCVELALKKRICSNFRFTAGFPESKAELAAYVIYPFKINEIKSYDLETLLFYSGYETDIKTNYLNEWQTVLTWSSEMRYIKKIIREKSANAFLKSATTLINKLI